jgi:hypothetical protein
MGFCRERGTMGTPSPLRQDAPEAKAKEEMSLLSKRKGIPFAIVGADGRLVVPEGAKLLPCPECQTETGHTSECSLSALKTGVYWLCVALPVNLMRTDAGSQVEKWPGEDETGIMKR